MLLQSNPGDRCSSIGLLLPPVTALLLVLPPTTTLLVLQLPPITMLLLLLPLTLEHESCMRASLLWWQCVPELLQRLKLRPVLCRPAGCSPLKLSLMHTDLQVEVGVVAVVALVEDGSGAAAPHCLHAGP